MISMRILILSYTIQQVIPNVCTKFQDPRCSSSWEIFDKIKTLEKKKNGQITRMISMRMLILSYMIQVVVPNVCTKIQNPRYKNFLLERKKKMDNKREWGCRFSHTQYNISSPMFVPNLKILDTVVPEKSLTEKKLTHTHTQTNIVTEKTKTIYPL